ncbi:hypothetical protein MRX96_011631 [Rhipicephalus microplus]
MRAQCEPSSTSSARCAEALMKDNGSSLSEWRIRGSFTNNRPSHAAAGPRLNFITAPALNRTKVVRPGADNLTERNFELHNRLSARTFLQHYLTLNAEEVECIIPASRRHNMRGREALSTAESTSGHEYNAPRNTPLVLALAGKFVPSTPPLASKLTAVDRHRRSGAFPRR